MSEPWPPPRRGRGGWLLLLLAAAMASGTSTTHPPAIRHPYVIPSCTGLARVPGYTQCHK